VDRFEQALAEATGLQSVAAVVNGTAALHACLHLLDVGPGDEVLVPSLTFIATANAVSYCGAVPHFVDSEERTLGVDAERLADYLRDTAELRGGVCWNRATGRRIRALIVMHTFGHPVDLDAAAEVARRFRLELVEDAAESLGTLYKGRHTGNWGRVAALSFNGNKTITTGGGGAVCTNDRELGLRAKHLTTTARGAHKWEFIHDAVGFNYRLPNINAALGCAQLEKLDEFVTRKRALAQRYQTAFASLRGARFFSEPQFARSNYWLNAILLDRAGDGARDAILEAANAAGFGTRPVWKLMHQLPMYTQCPKMELATAESLAERLINLPSSAFL
jgi:perosamine synthetase